ncbi:uncharacterized protein Dh31 isoform X2 [Atheta coriaria]|uniref:uncharacterized protein Dh31 isoform X2 n=1 Tax=Dalotia coriaria TaxID=877792 RepID=UPI0031F4121C
MPPPISAIKEAAAAAAVVRNAGRRAHRRWIPPSEELTIRNPTSSRPTHRKQLHQTYKFSRIFTQFSTTTRQVKMKFMVQPRINGIPMTLFVAAIVLLTVAQLSSASPMIPNYFDYDMHQKQNVQAPDFTKAGIQSTLEYLQNALNALNLEKSEIYTPITSRSDRYSLPLDGGLTRDNSGKWTYEILKTINKINNPNQ